MKLAISNIAWEEHNDPKVLSMLKNYKVSGIEVAPTKIWPAWEGASYQNARNYKKFMTNEGFELPAMQAILFGKPKLQIFNVDSHKAFFEHTKLVANLAQGLECSFLVWGAPKNRKRGQKLYEEAFKLATEFFYKVGEICKDYDCCVGLEPNPVEYGCDFINNVSDARALVKAVNHPHFRLHLDSGAIHMCGGDMELVIQEAGDVGHYHISEPMLNPIFNGIVNQQKGIKALRSIGYDKWVSIEMRSPETPSLLELSLSHVSQLLKT